jgi:hypothetical protein
MPSSSSLPEDLKSLAFRNALRVDSGADFHHHIDRLCSSLRSTASSSTPTVSGSPQPVTSTASPPRIDTRGKNRGERRRFVCMTTLSLFFFLGCGVGGWVGAATQSDTMGVFAGVVPTWLFGIGLAYFLWRRIR